MVYSAAKAYTNALADRINTPGMCLQQVRAWWGVGSKYGSAIAAWNGSPRKHRNDWHPPKGAPVFYSGGKYGHIAFSLGNGYVRSTDVAGVGRVGTVPLNWFKSRWGYTYLGWTGDLNGVGLPLSAATPTALPKVDLSELVRAAKTNPSLGGRPVTYPPAVHVERALLKAGVNPGPVDGHYGTTCRDAYRVWQRRLGYSGSAADGIPGMTSLTRLGRQTGLFTVVA